MSLAGASWRPAIVSAADGPLSVCRATPTCPDRSHAGPARCHPAPRRSSRERWRCSPARVEVGRTVADLAGSELIETEHLAEALSYRTGFGTEELARAV